MSLITIKRSPSSAETNEDSCDSAGNNEDFFACNATVILQNQIGRRRSSVIKEDDLLQCNLKKIIELLREEDLLQLMINLEKVNLKNDDYRYFCLVSTYTEQKSSEFLILGINVSKGKATIGLVLPVLQDMSVKLDGDGGFKIKIMDGEKLFKPTSVHGLWASVHMLNKACNIARLNNYYLGGLNHNWINYYNLSVNSNRAQIAEWNRMLDADTRVNYNLAPKSGVGEFVMGTEMDEERKNEEIIRKCLEEIMRDEDMDNITVSFLKKKLQGKLSFDINKYRSFITEEIFIIYGKMDVASKITPYLFLGSTYNASNLSELLENKITHILNVTRENENFYRERFSYKNVEVFDNEDTKLLNYFDSCFKFINEAKDTNGACLVHCQRGISRSATIVISYMMKESNFNFEEALKYVKDRRNCIRPNDGFLRQLKTYEGILLASSNRHNLKFRIDSNKSDRSSLKSSSNELEYISDKTLSESQTSYTMEFKRTPVANVNRPQFNVLETSELMICPSDENHKTKNSSKSIQDNSFENDQDLSVFKDHYDLTSELITEVLQKKCHFTPRTCDYWDFDRLLRELGAEIDRDCKTIDKSLFPEKPLTTEENMIYNISVDPETKLSDNIIDKQSLRPVKELRDIYTKQ